jgi:hypothetical protein
MSRVEKYLSRRAPFIFLFSSEKFLTCSKKNPFRGGQNRSLHIFLLDMPDGNTVSVTCSGFSVLKSCCNRSCFETFDRLPVGCRIFQENREKMIHQTSDSKTGRQHPIVSTSSVLCYGKTRSRYSNKNKIDFSSGKTANTRAIF